MLSHLPPSNFLLILPIGQTYQSGLESVVCRSPGPVMQGTAWKGKNSAENKQEITSIPYFLNVIFFLEVPPVPIFPLPYKHTLAH